MCLHVLVKSGNFNWIESDEIYLEEKPAIPQQSVWSDKIRQTDYVI